MDALKGIFGWKSEPAVQPLKAPTPAAPTPVVVAPPPPPPVPTIQLPPREDLELPHVREALKLLGQSEIKGPQHNPLIVEMVKASGLEPAYWSDETAWCAAMMSYISALPEAKIDVFRNAWAAAWQNYGRKLPSFQRGCIVVFAGHVGIAMEINATSVLVLGGNQKDKVGLDWYPLNTVIAWRCPTFNGFPIALVRTSGPAAPPAKPLLKRQLSVREKSILTMWENARIQSTRPDLVNNAAVDILANRARYETIQGVTGVPWYWIGACHFRESSLKFDRHLHNGDPLTARTRQVPAGRPVAGTPPFTFEQSAVDVLTLQGLDKVTEWDIVACLDKAERYNGMGYSRQGINSPYVWAETNHEQLGMYVADGKWDPSRDDPRPGFAAIFLSLQAKGVKIGEGAIA